MGAKPMILDDDGAATKINSAEIIQKCLKKF